MSAADGSEESSKANLTARSVTSPGCRWAGRPVHRTLRRALMRRFPFTVYYNVAGDLIEIRGRSAQSAPSSNMASARVRPNQRLKLPARVDCGMTLSSSAPQLKRDPLGSPY